MSPLLEETSSGAGSERSVGGTSSSFLKRGAKTGVGEAVPYGKAVHLKMLEMACVSFNRNYCLFKCVLDNVKSVFFDSVCAWGLVPIMIIILECQPVFFIIHNLKQLYPSVMVKLDSEGVK